MLCPYNIPGSFFIPANPPPPPPRLSSLRKQVSKKMDPFFQESYQFISLWIPPARKCGMGMTKWAGMTKGENDN
jgi:hypothetical protein